MLTWAYPDFWLAATGLALLVVLLGLYVGRSARLGRRLGLGVGRLAWKLPLRLVAGALLLVAWLGPALGVRQQAVRSSGQDVWLLVDVSRSMDAADVAPTRLLRTQAALSEVVAAFPADRLGLIVFGSQAYVQCPLTYDQASLQLFLNTLSTRLTAPGPTTLRAPLDLLLTRLGPAAPASPTSAGASPPRTVAAVLASDGEDFGENLEPILQALGRTGARVYTVGVGTAVGGPVPGPGGRTELRDVQGRPVVSRLREAPLLQIAAQTGGHYVSLNDRENGLPNLLASLRSLPPASTTTARSVAVADNRYRYPLGAALVLLLLDSLITVRVLRLEL
ncbi:VWA domain-containing protein [Hymenobacter ginsengisoli]|uniref:VWA domain-containing protein n=1 Tax=Hymenobacter ginsengisoli TaxID=1051626 RepID=A0ABP8QJT1_9BACT|nr:MULTISPECIES: VWA domain-containing protein [unclassified Hymenobacter]MBO2033375.1 VWA domain-containing protein [Hymenobacter sp. BT559]